MLNLGLNEDVCLEPIKIKVGEKIGKFLSEGGVQSAWKWADT